MANAKKKATEYDDDDEINKSLREFNEQKRKAEEADKAEPPPPDDEGDDDEGGFGITAKDRPSDFVGPMADIRYKDEVAKDVNAVIMTCSCCDKEWTLSGSMLNRPACSCPMYPTCTECGYCRNHCKCKAVKAAVQ